MTYLSTSLFKL